MHCSDGKTRCRWVNPRNLRYIAYHDSEWGIPLHDDHRLVGSITIYAYLQAVGVIYSHDAECFLSHDAR